MARLGESPYEEPAEVPATQVIPFASVWTVIRRAAPLSHLLSYVIYIT